MPMGQESQGSSDSLSRLMMVKISIQWMSGFFKLDGDH